MYHIFIRKVATGEVRTFAEDCPWEDHHVYMWSEGNYGCDCNRTLFFARAGNEPDPGAEGVCGSSAYVVDKIVLPSGEIVYSESTDG